MSELTKENILKIANNVKVREEDFGLLIVSKTTPALSLNFDGKDVWDKIDGQRTVSQIIEELSKDYNSDVLETKTMELLNGFLQLNLVYIV